jgi:hypothetical protein
VQKLQLAQKKPTYSSLRLRAKFLLLHTAARDSPFLLSGVIAGGDQGWLRNQKNGLATGRQPVFLPSAKT